MKQFHRTIRWQRQICFSVRMKQTGNVFVLRICVKAGKNLVLSSALPHVETD